jgi:hypothetical protein
VNAVFFETSVLVDYFFRSAEIRDKVKAALPTQFQLVSSRYIVFELARGFLRNLVLLHNKSTQVKRFSELQAYAQAVYRKQHLLGTVLGAFKDFFEEGLKRGAFEHPTMAPDEAMLLSFRGFLRGAIRRDWKDMMRSLQLVVNDVGCREDILTPHIVDGMYYQELKRERCGIHTNCGLKKYMSKERRDFEMLRRQLQSAPTKDFETTRRIKSLRELYRVEKADFERGDCYSCGDAIIAHEAPTSTVIATKNKTHFEPICDVFKKRAHYC